MSPSRRSISTGAGTSPSRKLAAAAKANRAFASQLQEVIHELDRHGGRKIINQVKAEINVQALGDHSMAAGRDIVNVKVPDRDDWSGSPSWVKATYGLGAVVCALGIAIHFLIMANNQFSPLGIGIFIIGFVILLLGAHG
jgi:hypothetical protein